MTFGVEPSITATHELVVPRSIPMTLAMVVKSSLLRQVGQAPEAPNIQPPYHSPSARWTQAITLGSYRRATLACKTGMGRKRRIGLVVRFKHSPPYVGRPRSECLNQRNHQHVY